MTMRAGRWVLAVVAATALVCRAAAPAGAAQATPAAAGASTNPYNEQLMRLPQEQQAAMLARFLGATCIGTKPFLMGVTKEGKAKGYAYWSLECAGGDSYMIQLDPDGGGAALDCRTLKQNGKGRECYKAF